MPRFRHARITVPPVLVAAVLSIPCLGLGYFWDDFVFLTRVQSNPLAALGPEPGTFYRPLPRAVYFWPLASLGSAGAAAAHAINLALLLASIVLLVSLVRNLAGARAGTLAGLSFAALGAVPSLVAWASGSQDLLAIALALAAFHLRNSGRNVAAGVALAAGLLSKETVAVLLPALILWGWILGRRPARVLNSALGFGALALAWAVLHPGVRELAARGFGTEPRGYVGFANLAVTEAHARRYVLSLLNVPDPIRAVAWPGEGIAILASAVLLSVVGVWLVSRRETQAESVGRISVPRAALLSFLIAAPGIALPALLIERWAAYFVCLPAIGSSILLGVLLARVPPVLAAAGIASFVCMGWLCRGIGVSGRDSLTEQTFIDASRAARQVEAGFRELHPTLPRGSQVLVSVASSGLLGIHGTMHDGQALRVWYRDPTIRTLRPELRLPQPRAEYLVRVTGSRDVVEIDPDGGGWRSSGAKPDSEEIRAVTRTFARGLAASGEGGRAVRILERLAASDPPSLRSYDLRLSAMVSLAEGDRAAAEQTLRRATPISRDVALYGVAKVMAEPSARAGLDSCAYAAFGVSSSDPDALRYLMEMFYASEFVPQAVHFARKVQDVAPGDSESAAILRELGGK